MCKRAEEQMEKEENMAAPGGTVKKLCLCQTSEKKHTFAAG